MNSTIANRNSGPLPRRRVLVIGGYGTFGSHVARELALAGTQVTVAGRNAAKAAEFAESLGSGCAGAQVDSAAPKSLQDIISGHHVAVQCAGPFSALDGAVLDACLEAGCHYVDIADDRAYCKMVRSRHASFSERDLVAAYGCSSLPAISLAAASAAARAKNEPPQRARVTLFIGNRNPKGYGAVASAARLIGRSITTPQGEVHGFCDRRRVPLPPPFGERTVVNFESPDLDLLPERLGARAVQVKVGFELSLVTTTFWLLANTLPSLGRVLLPRLAGLSGPLNRLGSSGGAVMAELTWSNGDSRRVSVVAKEDGQRMAALPAVYVAERLLDSNSPVDPGAQTAEDVLGAEQLLTRLTNDGYQVVRS